MIIMRRSKNLKFLGNNSMMLESMSSIIFAIGLINRGLIKI